MKDTSLNAKLLKVLQDGEPHTTVEILERVWGSGHLGLARVAPRVDDLKKMGYEIEGRHDRENPKIYIYQLGGAPKKRVVRYVEVEKNGVRMMKEIIEMV